MSADGKFKNVYLFAGASSLMAVKTAEFAVDGGIGTLKL